MRITRSNYESYFLDKLEGKLQTGLADELHLFLEQNPDLALELEQWQLLTLETDRSAHIGIKEKLKKPLVTESREPANDWQTEMFLCEDDDFETTLHESGKLKLKPDKTIVFANKELLKRKSITFALWVRALSAAAILLLGYFVLQPGFENQPDYKKLAVTIQNPDSLRRMIVPPVTEKETKKQEVKVPGQSAPAIIRDKIPAEKKLSPGMKKSGNNVFEVPKERAQEPETLPLKPRGISFGMPVEIELAAITLKDPQREQQEQALSELLKVQLIKMRHSEDLEFLSPDHLGLSGLQFFARLSGKRLTARKGVDGEVHSVSYNSRILAFSIPVNR